MNFDFSDDQKFLKDQANKFLTEKCDLSRPRKVLENKEPHDSDLWKAIVEMGWTGTTIPEEYGGLGLGHLELCVIAEELGRAIAPVPFSSSVYLATEALLLAGSEEQKQTYLPKLASGESIGTFAVSEGAKPATVKSIETKFDGGAISGTKVPVPDGLSADFAVVLVRTGASASEQSFSLAIADLASTERSVIDTMDPSRQQAQIEFTNTDAALLGEQGAGWDLYRRVLDRAAILFAFEQVGGADACLEMAKAYALDRYAFGRQIGSYQAIKHKLADMYINNELARSNAYYGAWALSSDAPELPTAAAGARVSATQAYHYASKENIQTHGGMGFTWEADCHLYYRRAKMLGLALGGERAWKEKLITSLEQRNVA